LSDLPLGTFSTLGIKAADSTSSPRFMVQVDASGDELVGARRDSVLADSSPD
jgi:hypothetical protein